MIASLPTPREAVAEMVAAGAVFTVQRRSGGLRLSFTFRVRPGGDLVRCREILASAKARPAPFFEALKAEVQRVTSETVGAGR